MNPSLMKCLFTTKVDVSEFMADSSSHFVTLRQPTTAEFKAITKAYRKVQNRQEDDFDILIDTLEDFNELYPTMIIDHDFYDSDKKLPSKDVAELITGNIELSQYMMQKVITEFPLAQKNVKA